MIGTASTPAQVTLGIGVAGVLTLTSFNTGMPWELGVGLAPLVPRSAGALVASDGQVLNLALSDPSLTFLWNLFQSPPFTNLITGVSSAAAIQLSSQMVVIDPSQLSGISISQPVRLTVQ